MARDWETQFRAWSTPPGLTEQQELDRAEKEVKTAIRASARLGAHDIDVIVQGSYRNRTNVPRESDVDVCVRCNDTFWYDLPTDHTTENVRRAAAIDPATYEYSDFKDDVEAALVARFGRGAVTRGDKAFNIRETNYRVDADVVATFQHRRYTGLDPYGRARYLVGTEFRTKAGKRIINWPQQHYDNGVAKNDRTRERFKAMVRVLKNLCNEMDDAGVRAADPVPSYLIECLVYNVPNATFGQYTYVSELREILRFAFLKTQTDEQSGTWVEVNELKYLFHWTQPWARSEANAFLSAAWQYVGYGNS